MVSILCAPISVSTSGSPAEKVQLERSYADQVVRRKLYSVDSMKKKQKWTAEEGSRM